MPYKSIEKKREASRKAQRLYRIKHRERIRINEQKARRLIYSDPEKHEQLKARGRAWYYKNSERVNRKQRIYNEANRVVILARKKELRELHRNQVIRAYGGHRCVCCGETESAFLSIDHINGGGTQRRKLYGRGHGYYLWLIRNNFPSGYQILCHNCNQARGYYGQCPHQKT